MKVIPGNPMPAIDARLVRGGGKWSMASEKPDKLALLAFYRGAFCPVCRVWLADLERLVREFEKRGVSVIALSCDPIEAAKKSLDDWGLKNLRVACELDPEDARKAGLYISQGRGPNPGSGQMETKFFCEPGLLLVNPKNELYAAWIQSMPYARPHLAEVLTAVDNVIARGVQAPRGSA